MSNSRTTYSALIQAFNGNFLFARGKRRFRRRSTGAERHNDKENSKMQHVPLCTVVLITLDLFFFSNRFMVYTLTWGSSAGVPSACISRSVLLACELVPSPSNRVDNYVVCRPLPVHPLRALPLRRVSSLLPAHGHVPSSSREHKNVASSALLLLMVVCAEGWLCRYQSAAGQSRQVSSRREQSFRRQVSSASSSLAH